VDGQRGADGSWTFDISPIVSGWLSGAFQNNGILLRPASGLAPTDNFEVVWQESSITADGAVTADSASATSSPAASSSDFSSPSSSASDASATTPDTTPSALGGGDLSSSSTPSFSTPAPTSPSPTTAAPAAAAR